MNFIWLSYVSPSDSQNFLQCSEMHVYTGHAQPWSVTYSNRRKSLISVCAERWGELERPVSQVPQPPLFSRPGAQPPALPPLRQPPRPP